MIALSPHDLVRRECLLSWHFAAWMWLAETFGEGSDFAAHPERWRAAYMAWRGPA